MSLKDTCISVWEALTVTLASGSSLTEAINLGGLRLFGLVLPATWTAADLTFQVSTDGGSTWANLYEQDGTEVIASGKTSGCLTVHPSVFAAFQYIRIRSGTSAVPVSQTADRALKLIVRGV